MELNQKKYGFATLHRMTGAPILFRSEDGTLHHYQPFQLESAAGSLDFIAERLRKVSARYGQEHILYLLHPSMVMLGIVHNPQTREFVFVGPIASSAATAEGVDDYLFEAGLSADTTKKLAAYLKAASSFTLPMLQELLVFINLILNNEIRSTKEIIALHDPETKVRETYIKDELTKEEIPALQDQQAAEEYNARLNHCVTTGDLAALAELITQIGSYPYTEPLAINLREEKINAFGSIYALERLVLDTGFSGPALEATKKYYLTRLDNAPTLQSIRQLTVSAIFDFTKHVKTYLSEKTNDPTVNRIIRYIKEHINEKLLCEEIAEALRISPHTLFTRFKEATGQTVNEFIAQEKIRKACYYIRFTDKSAAEIADHLSFSFQSYFQVVFRKVMGKTPREWQMEQR